MDILPSLPGYYLIFNSFNWEVKNVLQMAKVPLYFFRSRFQFCFKEDYAADLFTPHFSEDKGI